ncbi:Uncharacterized HTH-type transcriptional regulator R00410 (fragment) [Candidatus Terasakiella magnetica]
MPISFFFDDMSDQAKELSPAHITKGNVAETIVEQFPKDPLLKRETLELVRAYYAIPNDKVRRQVYELAKSLATVKASSAA